MNLDFNGVEAAKEGGNNTAVISKGIRTLKITKMEVNDGSDGRTPNLNFEFTQEGIQYPMNERFYLSDKAKPRLKSFYEAVTKEVMPASINTDMISAKLVGRTNEYLVDAEEVEKVKDGTTFINERPTFRYTGFVDPAPTAEPKLKTLPPAETAVTGTAEEDFAMPAPVDITTATDDGLPF